MQYRVALVVVLGLLSPCMGLGGAETVPGPVEADVLTVTDGDTIGVRAHIWPGHYVEVAIRLAGIDTPELRGKCDAERDLALKAKTTLAGWLASGRVRLFDVTYDKYGGRAVARVETETGMDVASNLISSGLAHAYQGRTKPGWC